MFPDKLQVLSTGRLRLRQLKLSDDKAIFALRNNQEVNQYIQRPLLENINDARGFIAAINEGIQNKEWLYWAMELKQHLQVIGTVCFWHFSNEGTMAEAGYEMHPSFGSMGLMQEAFCRLLTYGFDTLQLHAVEAFTQPANQRSIHLLQKNGFVQSADNARLPTTREIRFVLSHWPLTDNG